MDDESTAGTGAGAGFGETEASWWAADAPRVAPRVRVGERADIMALRAREVAGHRRALSRSRIVNAVRRLAGRRDGLPIPAGLSTGAVAPEPEAAATLPDVPLVSVIIPTRDRPELLARVLDGLDATAWPRLETIVVDNASSDPGVPPLLSRPGVRAVDAPMPFNFPRLCNRGASAARGDVLVFLNNDVEVVDPDWLRPLVDAVRDPDTGPVGCLLTYPDGSIQHCGIAIGPDGPVHPHRGESPGDVPEAVRSGDRTAVTAACLAIRAGAFWALGGFDPLFMRDYNDVDLCLRASRAGYRVRFAGDVALVHHESLSRGREVHPETVGDWFVMRARWGEELRADRGRA